MMSSNLMGGARQKVVKQMVEKMIHGESGDIITGLIASKEIDLLRRVNRLHDALGISEIEHIPAKEDRKEQMKGLIEALVSGDVPAFWFEQIGRERLSNPDDAEQYLNMSGDEWGQQCDRIVQSYRQQGDERPRSAIMCDYVGRKFDVDVGWFVAHVVNWTPQQKRNVASTFLLGNFNAVGNAIDMATEEIENAEDNHATDE